MLALKEVTKVGRQSIGAWARYGVGLGKSGPISLLGLRPQDLDCLRAEVRNYVFAINVIGRVVGAWARLLSGLSL